MRRHFETERTVLVPPNPRAIRNTKYLKLLHKYVFICFSMNNRHFIVHLPAVLDLCHFGWIH